MNEKFLALVTFGHLTNQISQAIKSDLAEWLGTTSF